VPSTDEHRPGFGPGGAYKNDTVGTEGHSNHLLACGELIYRDFGEGVIWLQYARVRYIPLSSPPKGEGEGGALIATEDTGLLQKQKHSHAN